MGMRIPALFGGLFNSLHRSKSKASAGGGLLLSAYKMQNVSLKHGILEGREGYKTISELSGVEDCYGLVYGEYGGNKEFVTVMSLGGTAMPYVITPDGNFTSVGVAVHASDWEFAQFEKWVFAVNENEGIRWKRVGVVEWLSNSLIPSPSAPPNLSVLKTDPNVVDFSPATVVVSGHPGLTVTVVNNNYLKISNGSTPITSVVKITVTATFPSTFDWTYRDAHSAMFQKLNNANINLGTIAYRFTNNDASPVVFEPYKEGVFADYGDFVYKLFQFVDQGRPYGGTNLRDNIKVLTFEFDCISADASKDIAYLLISARDVWLNDTLSLDIFGAAQSTIEYAYSYYDVSDSIEGGLSPVAISPVVPLRFAGNYIELVGQATTSGGLTASDKLYFYRKEKATGKWRRIGEAANTGIPVVNDTFMEHELALMPVLAGMNINQNMKATAICVWKGCLVVCENDPDNDRVGVAYLSFVGQPFRFLNLNSDGTEEETSSDDESRGRTLYISPDRARHVLAVVGQDSLYFVTEDGVYVMVGDLPSTATAPRKLPSSRGAVSKRGVCAWSSGVLVAAKDGLWFYRIDRNLSGDAGSLQEKEFTEDVRGSWKRLRMNIEGTDIDDTSLFVVVYHDEVWCINKRRYMRLNRLGLWEEGVFPIEVEFMVSTVRYGLIGVDSNSGKFIRFLYDLSEQSYRSDDGAPIDWRYESGFIDSDRVMFNNMCIVFEGNVGVETDIYDGSRSISRRRYDYTSGDHSFMFPSSVPPGRRFAFTVFGQKTETLDSNLQSLHLEGEKVADGYGTE